MSCVRSMTCVANSESMRAASALLCSCKCDCSMGSPHVSCIVMFVASSRYNFKEEEKKKKKKKKKKERKKERKGESHGN